MKLRLYTQFFTFFLFLLSGLPDVNAQVGIGTTTPASSAILELSSTSKGFLPPRMTEAEKAAIASPVAGLMIYQINNSQGLYYYTGSAWTGPLSVSDLTQYLKADGTVAASGDINLGGQKITNLASPTSSTDGANKSYVDGLTGGLTWKESVVNLVSSAPSGPATGSRYILTASWGGGSTNQIATYNGTSWTFTTPSNRDAVFATTPSNGYVFNGTTWNQFNSSVTYTFGTGLSNSSNTISLANSGVATTHIADGAVTAAKLNSMGATSGQILRYNGTSWAPTTLNSGTVTSVSVGSGLSVSNATTTPTISLTTVPVANGGTGTSNGSITGTGALTFAAGGSNQNVTLTPSGSGYTLLNGKVGMGISTPATSLHIQNSNTYGGSDNPGSTSVPSVYINNSSNSSSSAHAILAVRTGGNSGGNPYISWDINSVKGYSMGISNSTDQLIINSRWDFATGTAANNMMIFNETGQSRVIIPNDGGSYNTSWPSGWGGGIATYDMSLSGIYYTTLTARSDRRLKNEINSISSGEAQKLLKLNPVTYYWNKGICDDHALQYGFIAQDIENIFPDIVSTASDEMQTKSVNYQSFHALTVKMIQDQEAEIQNLKALLEKRQQQIDELKSLIQENLKK
jgi:hypothetical protein